MCKSTDNIFYVYVYLDPRKPKYRVYGNYEFDYEPFYVGKGCNDRAYSHLKGNRYNRHFTNKINKIRKKRSNALKGHIVTQEQIQKTKETCLKKRLEREANKLPKPPKWLITYPNGTTIKVVNLNKFCKENGLLRQGLHNLTKGHGKTYKGFKCEKI